MIKKSNNIFRMINFLKKSRTIVRIAFILPMVLLSCEDSQTTIFDKTLDESATPIQTRATEIKSDYYSVVPGTDEWAQFESSDEMIKSCQLSEKMLDSLPTRRLVEACLEYPLAYDFILVDDERSCISSMIDSFNGLKELTKREDAIFYLLDQYACINKDNRGKAVINKSYLLSLAYLELLICDKSFIKKMSDVELETFQAIALEKYYKKIENIGYYGVYSLKHSLLVLAEISFSKKSITDKSDLECLNYYVNNYKIVSNETLTHVSGLLFNQKR